jgi:hypothetical protein
MRVSAIGRLIVIHPCFTHSGKWVVVQADKNGDWKSGSVCDTKDEAQAERSRLFRLHRTLAKRTERSKK